MNVTAPHSCELQREAAGQSLRYPLHTIYFYLVDACNLRCRHCWIDPKYQGAGGSYTSLDPSLFSKIVREGRQLGLSSVRFTGGEPLLHPALDELLDCVRENGLQLSVETNGMLCSPSVVRTIRESCPTAYVAVSLDGVDAETHDWMRGVRGAFERTLRGIRNLVEAGIVTQVIMTITRHNVGQIGQLVRMAEQMGIESVKFNHIQPTARGVDLYRNGDALTVAELVALGEWMEQTLIPSTSLRIEPGHPIAFRPLSRIFGNKPGGCGLCGIFGVLGVLAGGKYALCGIGELIPELILGNASEESLETVWTESSLLSDIREGMPHRLQGVCSQCLFSARCLGSCIAQNYYSKRDIWAPYWYCEQAHEAGLFPSARLRADA